MRVILAKIPEILICLFPFFLILGAGLADTALTIIAFWFLLTSFFQRDFGWLKSPWVPIAFFFWIYCITISFSSLDFKHAFTGSIFYIRFILFAAALEYRILKDPRTEKRLLYSLVAALLFTIFDVYVQWIFGHDIFGIQNAFGDRLTGPFKHLRAGGYLHFLLYPALLPGLYMLWKGKGNWVRVLSIPLIAIFILPIFLSGERVQIPLLIIAFIVFAFLWEKERKFFLATGVFIFVSSFIVVFTNPVFEERLITKSLSQIQNLKEDHYGQIWQRSVKIFFDSPLFGNGMNNFRVKCPEERFGPTENIESKCGLHPHNFYLELLTETGIIGFILFLTLVIIWLKKSFQHYRQWKNIPLHIGLITAFIISIIPFLPTRSLFNNWRMAIFWFIIGWLMASSNRHFKKKKDML